MSKDREVTMNKQYISEAFDQLNQMQKKSRKRLTEANGNIIRNGYDGWDFVEQVAQEEISSGDYENKAEFISSVINFLKGSIDDLDKDDIKEIRTYLKQVWDQWQVADESLTQNKKKRIVKEELSKTINSFRQLKKLHTDNITSFMLGKSLLYDYLDSLQDNWSESIDGVEDEDEAFSLFRIRGNNAYLPKGTTLDYVGHDDYYDWFRVNGTDKKLGFISDYSMYD